MVRQDSHVMTEEIIDNNFNTNVDDIDTIVKGKNDNIPKRTNINNGTKIIIEDAANNTDEADIGYNTWDDFHNVRILIKTGNEDRYEVKSEIERIFKSLATRNKGLTGDFDEIDFNEIEMNGNRFAKYEIGYNITYKSYTKSLDNSVN